MSDPFLSPGLLSPPRNDLHTFALPIPRTVAFPLRLFPRRRIRNKRTSSQFLYRSAVPTGFYTTFLAISSRRNRYDCPSHTNWGLPSFLASTPALELFPPPLPGAGSLVSPSLNTFPRTTGLPSFFLSFHGDRGFSHSSQAMTPRRKRLLYPFFFPSPSFPCVLPTQFDPESSPGNLSRSAQVLSFSTHYPFSLYLI